MKKILDKLKVGLVFLFVIGVIYFIINIGVLLWFLISPKGFWGVSWFYLVFSGSLYVITQVPLILFASIAHWGKRGLLYGVPLVLLFLVLITVEFGPTLLIPQKLYSKYRYVERTEEYFKRGSYKKALEYAIETYDDNKNIQSNRFWFLKSLFLNTDKGQLYAKNREYQAKLNYAVCLHLSGISPNLSESLYEECDSLGKHFFSDKEDYSILPLTLLSNLYFSQGRIYESERINNKLFSSSASFTDEDAFHLIDGLLTKSVFLQRLGDYEKAQDIIQHAHKIYIKSGKSKKSSYYLQLILSYINVKYINGDLTGINDLLNQAKGIAEKNKKRVIYIDYLNYRARYEEYQNNTDEAEKLYRKALKRSKRKDPIEYAKQLSTNGNYLSRRERYKEALDLYYRALEVLVKKNYQGGFGSHNQFSGIIKSNYALGNIPQAIKLSKAIDSLTIAEFNQYYMILSLDEREKLSFTKQKHFDTSNSIYISANEDVLVENVYNNILATKSISLLSNKYIEDYLKLMGDIELQEQYVSLISQKREVESLSLLNSTFSSRYHSKLDSISYLEREFYRRLTDHGDYKPFDVASIKWRDVKSKLDSNEVAIEFVRSPQSPLSQDDYFYYALVLNSNSHRPELVRLCNEQSILNILNNSNNLKNKIDSVYSNGSESELYKLIWNPLIPYLKDKNQVYISLSGLLNSISMPALTIDESYSVKVLSSTRQILDLKSKDADEVKKSLVFGDINYNSELENTLQLENKGVRTNPSIYRSIKSSKLNQLEGTQIEINELEQLLDFNAIETTIRRGDMASEAAFRSLIHETQPEILHIATHGFYYPKESSVVMRDIVFNVESDYSVIENPMFRSGLFLAGADNKTKSTFENDGVLTANEIAGFDLSSVELVVLSACETGLGDVIGNEGVFGLQRAFKMAGANKLIMSLWKVPDKETAKLMSKFYRYYLERNNAHDALKKAQNEMREIHPEPFYWAGFFVLE